MIVNVHSTYQRPGCATSSKPKYLTVYNHLMRLMKILAPAHLTKINDKIPQ